MRPDNRLPTARALALLRSFESRNVTFIESDRSWPMVWERAKGMHAWDPEGKKYLDMTAAFGVAAAGHANRRVVDAGRRQMGRLLHAMGDVHPHAAKALLARELSRLTFGRWNVFSTPASRGSKSGATPLTGKVIFNNSGFEAVEAALKTALLATGKRGVIAFHGAYHGLGYGALNVTHRGHFRDPFRRQLREFGHFLPFPRRADEIPDIEAAIKRLVAGGAIGAILAEPVQARGGIHVPPPEFLPMLRRACDDGGALLIVDEIYTGFGRTGKWFACEQTRTVPDLICVGKALTGGFPLSACVGRAGLMDRAWPETTGEAIHTSTFLGHPVGCAMALAQIAEIRERGLVARSARSGSLLLQLLAGLKSPGAGARLEARGIGLMAGLEMTLPDGRPASKLAMRVIKEMLRNRFVLLPEGGDGNVISFTPPLIITEPQIRRTVAALEKAIAAAARK